MFTETTESKDTKDTMKKPKTTPKEKMIIGLMEEVINILSTCKLEDPEFAMYDVMKDAVEKEVRYPLYDYV